MLRSKVLELYLLIKGKNNTGIYGGIYMKDDKKYLGYMRVSSREQKEDRQRIALLEMGVPEKNIFMDKLSGKNFERPQYKKC